MRETLKRHLESRGWYLRRLGGVPVGTEYLLDIRHRMKRSLKVVLDVGAHRGETVRSVLAHFPHARIFAFEPEEANFRSLEFAVARAKNVNCYRLAVGSSVGSAQLFLHSDSQTHTLRSPPASPVGARSVEAETVTLDSFLQAHSVEAIDLLKIDVEGYELEVLTGARDTLKAKPPAFIFVESTLDPSDTVHTQLTDITKYLTNYGYNLTSIYDQVVWLSPRRLSYFNALFCHD